MFGIFIKKHQNLSRILTDYGFKWNPLKKDFPLIGFIELKYFFKLKRLKYKKVKMLQEYRMFFLNKNFNFFF